MATGIDASAATKAPFVPTPPNGYMLITYCRDNGTFTPGIPFPAFSHLLGYCIHTDAWQRPKVLQTHSNAWYCAPRKYFP